MMESNEWWVVHVDGSSNSIRSEVGLILLRSKGVIAEYTLRFDFPATNNDAKHEALIVGLRITKELRVQKFRICTNSQLVVGQVKGDFEVREENMKEYLQKVKDLASKIDGFDIRQVP
ncbi:uncharacterized protein [Elaeis guineensis]|uniref:uncharacterized protein n=1 Tax=Elaeis guineensis var. tenera TaxID=51953 RepID=UPI003C6CDF87